MLKKLFFALLVFSLSTTIFALDDQGNPNDPRVNDRANACYEDGSMAGKCDTEWEWTCGWYMIRFDYGLYSREEIPTSCASLLPPLPGEEAEAIDVSNFPTAYCVHFFDVWYVNFNGGNHLGFEIAMYMTPDCTGTITYTGLLLVYAPDGVEAAAILCHYYFNQPYDGSFGNNDVHFCGP